MGTIPAARLLWNQVAGSAGLAAIPYTLAREFLDIPRSAK